MSEILTVEPSAEQRSAFARWALSKDPAVQTVGTGGFLIRMDDYVDAPAELLEGSYVDGFPYDRPAPQPELKTEAVPLTEIRLPVPPKNPEPLAAETRHPLVAEQPRKRAPRKRAPRKPKADPSP